MLEPAYITPASGSRWEGDVHEIMDSVPFLFAVSVRSYSAWKMSWLVSWPSAALWKEAAGGWSSRVEQPQGKKEETDFPS